MKIKNIIERYLETRRKLAEGRIELFAARIYSLIKENDYDLIISPGNSGLIMTEISKTVYEYSKKEFPKSFVLPIYRDGTKYEEKLDIKRADNVLFVDDEIMTGTSAKECIKAIVRSFPDSAHIDVTIVAEHMFFEWHYKIPGVSVHFYPYGRAKSGKTNNISHILSDRNFKKLTKYIPIHAEKKQVLAMLLSGKLKNKNNNGEWFFDETVEGKVVARTKDYANIKREALTDINLYVKSGIEKHKDKRIKFVGE